GILELAGRLETSRTEADSSHRFPRVLSRPVLSRRRSRVRVPSLPSLRFPAERTFVVLVAHAERLRAAGPRRPGSRRPLPPARLGSDRGNLAVVVDRNHLSPLAPAGARKSAGDVRAAAADDDRLHCRPRLDAVAVGFALREICVKRVEAKTVAVLARHRSSVPPPDSRFI